MLNNSIIPPRIAKFPYEKLAVPRKIYGEIMEEYYQMNFFDKVEDVIYSEEYENYICCSISVGNSKSPYTYIDRISDDLYDKIYELLTPIAEKWCGVELEKTWGYGIRSYVNNSVLHLHRDKIDTHVISCIIYVDQKSEKNWPLDFYDHDNNHHQVFFEDGDMLFYESLCVHGRETPFQGDYYRNMYFHWKPKNWECENLKKMKVMFRDGIRLKNFYSHF